MSKRPKTRNFTCWVVGRREETEEIIEAVTAWEARKHIAGKHGVSATEAAGRRIPEEGKRKRKGDV